MLNDFCFLQGKAPVPGKQGAGASDAVTQNLKAQIVNLKRENNEANARIKQLEMEVKKGGHAGTTGSEEVFSC